MIVDERIRRRMLWLRNMAAYQRTEPLTPEDALELGQLFGHLLAIIGDQEVQLQAFKDCCRHCEARPKNREAEGGK